MYLSPYPNISPDPSQQFSEHNLSKTIENVCEIANKATEMMEKFKIERDAKNSYISMRDDAVIINEENIE